MKKELQIVAWLFAAVMMLTVAAHGTTHTSFYGIGEITTYDNGVGADTAFVIIATPLPQLCISKFKDGKADIEIPCHDSIQRPVPKELKSTSRKDKAEAGTEE